MGDHPFLSELAAAVHDASPLTPLLIAEDERNLAALAQPRRAGGAGLDALWADDFHHELRRLIAGDSEGYFRSYSGTTGDSARTIERGWFYCGDVAPHTGCPRGSDPLRLSLEQFVFCIQNHDQVGNRALGERLNTQVAPAVYRAASALLLCAPETPMLFMGQEWGASSPFLYFTDHEPTLGAAITKGRRAEFGQFSAFHDPAVRDAIPDPQAETTFRSSCLLWQETASPEGEALVRLYRRLLALRRTVPALRSRERRHLHVTAPDAATIVMWRFADADDPIVVVARFAGGGEVRLRDPRTGEPVDCRIVLTTDDDAADVTTARPRVQRAGNDSTVVFESPAAIVLRARRTGGPGSAG